VVVDERGDGFVGCDVSPIPGAAIVASMSAIS
jgi:hypothetical protein